MKKNVKMILSFISICTALFFTISSTASAIPTLSPQLTLSRNISEEAFDGYEGIEITTSGKVGFNYDLMTSDGQTLLIGFNPNKSEVDSYYKSVYSLGFGWEIKLPYINENYFYEEGYQYRIENDTIMNYPGTYTLTQDANGYCLIKADGSKKQFAPTGRLIKTIDAFGNETIYTYTDNLLTQITYSNGKSVLLDRKEITNTILLKYDGFPFATINLSDNNELYSIQDNKGIISFQYEKVGNYLRLLSCSTNKHTKSIQYDINNRIKSVLTTYMDDGYSIAQQYFYNPQGRIYKIFDGDVEEAYEYTMTTDGSLTINTTKKYNGIEKIDQKTWNRYGQLVKYITDDTTLELEYNAYNRVSKEKENNFEIHYSYNPQGKISLTTFSDGDNIAYDYYSNGVLRKETSNGKSTYYAPNGDITKIEMANKQIDINEVSSSDILSTRSVDYNIQVLYNINSYVGVTNYHTYYNLPQGSFNCYSYAIGRTESSYSPGYFSGRNINLNSFTGIKLNVEEDIKALGMGIYDCGVNTSIPGHCWQIALRIRPGDDFHFMSRNRNMSWGFKAGKICPVMEVLNGRTPNDITWDMYEPSNGTYSVFQSNYYTSTIAYMMIRG